MFSRKILAVVLAAALAMPAVSMAASQPITKSATVQLRATVVAIDQGSRMVTLQGEGGKVFEVQAGDAVKHLDQVKVGDVVAVTYTEALAFQVVPKGEKSQGVSETAQRTATGGEVGRQVTSYFKIDAYNAETHLLWGTTAAGITKSITVQDPAAQAKLAKLIPGDVIAVTYSETLAVNLEKVER